MTLAQLLAGTTSAELTEWRAYFKIRNRLIEEERERNALRREAEAGLDQ